MNKENLYLEIVNHITDGVYFVNTKRQISFWNKAAEDITGYTSEEMIGRHCQDNLLSHVDSKGVTLCSVGCPLYNTILDGEVRTDEVFLRHKEGHRVPVKISAFPLKEGDETIGAVEIFKASSPYVYESDLIETLSNSARSDLLTGLPNRRNLESFLDYKLKEINHQMHGNQICLVFLDIDNFSAVNNTYGHEVGDKVLKKISKSIVHTVRKSDLFGRWGGEEFVGIFEVRNGEEALLVAEKVRILIKSSQIDPGECRPFYVTASVGVTLAKFNDTVESIVNRADALMYESKQKGKNRTTLG